MADSVSVALCTHNGSRHVGRQIESILAQSRPVDEIVMGDDASHDDTIAVVTRLAAAAGVPLRVLTSPEPLGITKNFERTILACTGDFVALSDQDDIWHPDRIERTLRGFSLSPSLALIHADAVLVDGCGSPLGSSLFEALGVTREQIALVESGRGFGLYLKRNLATGATTMLRRSLAELAAPFPSSWLHDEWLAIVAAARGELGIIPEAVIDYRQHGGNQIGAAKLSRMAKMGRLLEPGTARNARLLARASELVERLADMPGVTFEQVEETRAKLAHEQARSDLPLSRVARPLGVLRELRTGRYGRFGRGLADAARDIVQPLPPVSSARVGPTTKP
jgi:glycosyltransferase involved in cell wall biosynthesis